MLTIDWNGGYAEVLSSLLLSLQEGARVTTNAEDVEADEHW